MEYFVLKGQKGNPIPQIINWRGKLDIRKLTRKTYKELPQYMVLDMKLGTDFFYPDILGEPIFLVSREVMEIIKMYEESMPFLYVALFDTEKKESKSYYCPVLEESNVGHKGVIYQIRKNYEREVRARLDLVESMLSRGATGIELEALEEDA